MSTEKKRGDSTLSSLPVSRTDLTEEGACAGAGAGADRGETANLSPKIATGTATATLGSNHEVASEPHHSSPLAPSMV